MDSLQGGNQLFVPIDCFFRQLVIAAQEAVLDAQFLWHVLNEIGPVEATAVILIDLSLIHI